MESINELKPEEFVEIATRIENEVAKVIVGQKELIRNTLITLLAGGNALLEGVPGLGKTILVKTLAQTIDCHFSRIQFTPDLMPADIVGTNLIMENAQGVREFKFENGPIFANLILADEINRATPKTQSAMLEAMQEHSVTVSKITHPLPEPFFVLATQNPLEMEGTYPLPEAQLDRFMFKINVPFPTVEDLVEIANRTTVSKLPEPDRATNGESIRQMQFLARDLPIASHITEYSAKLLSATHPNSPVAPSLIKQFVHVGASPRGMQAMVIGGKILALLDGRFNVAYDDIRTIAVPALRHRVILNFEAQAENISPDDIIATLLDKVIPEPI